MTKEEVNMSKKVFLTLVLIASLLSLIWLASSQSTASKSLTKADPSPTSSVPSKEAVSAKLATLERGWVKNEGQWDKQALFSAPGYFGTTWIAKDGQLVHAAIKGKESWVISERWAGGKVQTITPEEELPTKVSYFVGNNSSKHKTNLPTYRYVSLGEVWSGVEVKLKATQKTVEKLFYVKPGADPSKIVVEVDGAKGLKLSKDGEIIIQTGLGDLKLSKPVAWQEKDGKKLPVEVSYKLVGKNRYSFVVAKADPSLPIVIDPILQSTYLGGNTLDSANAIAIHPTTGDVYVAGWTLSTDFPKTTGGAQASCSSCSSYGIDAFVARLNSSLTQILQSTYLGGNGADEAKALAIHPTTGEVYVVGSTSSTNFPNTSGGAQATHGGGSFDAFVARLNKELTQILQSTYLGGRYSDSAHALVIHPTTGEVYVAGYTDSDNFPGTSSRSGTDYDAFVARLRPDLRTGAILQSIYLGGSGGDSAYALAISSSGDVYVAGETTSTDFPNTSGGAQTSNNGNGDAFVARLNSNLTSILQSTYVGGSGLEWVRAFAIHPTTGDVYIAGTTTSTDLPRTTGGAQATFGGNVFDAFVVRLNRDLTQILQSTYLGGDKDDLGFALTIHPTTGEVYVAGRTRSFPFPGTAGGAQEIGGISGWDAFIARLNKELTQILQSTYLGGLDVETAYALAIHPTTGEVYVAGETGSTNFPKTSGGAQQNNGGGSSGGFDAFVSRLTADLAAGSSSSGSGGSGSGDSGSGSGGGSGSGSGGGGGGGCSMTGYPPASPWNLLVWASLPVFVLVRRVRRR
jgi:hypothetical protein